VSKSKEDKTVEKKEGVTPKDGAASKTNAGESKKAEDDELTVRIKPNLWIEWLMC
jgi:hypothetical protein